VSPFEDALALVLSWEGVYDCDPHDPGGETCYGISRVNFPAWSGWAFVDKLKAQSIPVSDWRVNQELQRQVALFYRQWWDSMSLSEVTPALAVVLFGGSINQGRGRVVKWLQESLNELGAPIVAVDGALGPGTVEACKWIAARGITSALVDKVNLKRVRAYHQTAKSRPESAKFLIGWLNRLFNGA